MDGLPEGAIFIILSFLEVNDIFRCACVSKSWNRSAQYIAKYLGRETLRAQVHLEHF